MHQYFFDVAKYYYDWSHQPTYHGDGVRKEVYQTSIEQTTQYDTLEMNHAQFLCLYVELQINIRRMMLIINMTFRYIYYYFPVLHILQTDKSTHTWMIFIQKVFSPIFLFDTLHL